MAKRALLDVLSSTIGRYVQDLDEEKLNVAVWSGRVELSNLSLDIDAVNRELARQAAEAPNLAVPLRVVEGRFDSLEVEVPWARITSRSVVVRAAGLHVVVEPHRWTSKDGGEALATSTLAESMSRSRQVGVSSSDNVMAAAIRQKRDARSQSLKFSDESRLRANAVRRLAALDDDDDMIGVVASDGGGLVEVASELTGSSFAARLVQRIAENLQLEIDSVHISLKGCGCSAGVVLESLALFTTDSNGNRTFVDREAESRERGKEIGHQNSFLHKELQIQGFGVYCDEDEVSLLGRMQQHINAGPEASKEHSYILSPLSFTAKLRRSDLLRCVDFPKYQISSELKSLSVVMSRSQLDLSRRILSSLALDNNLIRPLFPEYRPTLPLSKSTAKEWWRYAARCVGRLNRQRCWIEFYIAFKKRKAYIPLYKRAAHHDSCPWLSKLTIAETADFDTIEQDHTVSLQGIMCWRNIADAQVEKEREKHEAAVEAKGRAFTNTKSVPSRGPWASIFGRAPDHSVNSATPSGDSSSNEDGIDSAIPPITLTADEMTELESIGLDTTEEVSSLSADSKLCKVNFTLGSFRVNLVSYGLQPLTALQMGTFSSTFNANADGSFDARFTMLSLAVDDMVTARSHFPCVVKSLQASQTDRLSTGADAPSRTHALDFNLTKSKTGDQDLVLQMAAFEIVAASLLFKELFDFFSVKNGDTVSNVRKREKRNPILQQSMTGSVDLFYDADLGDPDLPSSDFLPDVNSRQNTHTTTTAEISDRLTDALVEAWTSKTQSKRAWRITCDIHAPIFIIPQNSVDQEAPVLVCDLGSFNFRYGGDQSYRDVQEWFDSHPPRDGSDAVIDHCSLDVRRLSFMLCKAGDIGSTDDNSSSPRLSRGADSLQSVVEPVTLSLKIGIDTGGPSLDKSRKCIYGILPDVTVRLSPEVVNGLFLTYSTWMRFLATILSPTGQARDLSTGSGAGFAPLLEEGSTTESSHDGIEIIPLGSREASSPNLAKNIETESRRAQEESNNTTIASSGAELPSDYLHVSIALRKLSARLSIDSSNGLEAHLVSAVLSSTLATDGASLTRLRMGWFWIMDDLHVDFARKQRLISHSNLPRPASEYADDRLYDIIGDLEAQGVFDDSYLGSSDLADITIATSVSYGQAMATDVTAVTKINAAFTSLFLNWNPQAVKHILSQSSLFNITFPSASLTSDYIERNAQFWRDSSRSLEEIQADGAISSRTQLIVMDANMSSFTVSMNSAIDDLPLYTLTMAEAKLEASVSESKSQDEQNIIASFLVDDIKMETPTSGQTHGRYKSIFGRAPEQSASLFALKYCQGREALGSFAPDGIEGDKFFSYAEICVAPSRFVYIQAQILTLAEYVTEGVLGAIFERVASSAAAAAIDMAQTSEEKDKLFHVDATGLHLVVPESATSPKFFSLNAGDLAVEYLALANERGGEAKCSVADVTMACDEKLAMLHDPIKMSIDVLLAPIDGATEEERAITVDINISSATFLLTRRHYAQVMDTLATNIAEERSFLRGKEFSLGVKASDPMMADGGDLKSISSAILTHGGVNLVVIERHIYIRFAVARLGVELCNEDTDDTIVSLAGVQSNILLRLLPEQDKICAEVTLHDLLCEDRRLQAVDRRFRRLLSCQKQTVDDKEESDRNENDLFSLIYEKNDKTEETSVDLTIGSPQLTIIPDCIVEVLEFLRAGLRPVEQNDRSTNSGGTDEGTSGLTLTEQQMKVGIKTSNCRLVLIDMGSAPGTDAAPITKSLKKAAVLTESMVIQGKLEGVIDLRSDIHTGEILQGDHQIHGEHVEIYTAKGVDLDSSAQVMEPCNFSVFSSTIVNENDVHEIEVKGVTLSNIDIIVSMQNVALVKAILSSISDSLEEASRETVADVRRPVLTETEEKRIKRLASALDKADDGDTDQSLDSLHSDPSETDSIKDITKSTVKGSSPGYVIRIKATIPETIITVVNDLQGLDDALFKLLFKNFVCGGEFEFPTGNDTLPQFRFHVNTAIVAQYFDANSLLWESLLVKPWDIHFNGLRAPQKRFKSNRLSTSFDIDSHPCYLSFSEQFLVSIGAASRMWSMYSTATQKAMDLSKAIEGDDLRSSMTLRKSLAACAARSLVTTMPYGIENHTGISCKFATKFGDEEKPLRSCRTGTTHYFHFDPSPGNGTGGKRLYGQDVMHLKSVKIFFGDSIITLDHIDAMINMPRQAHLLEAGVHVFTEVLRNKKATFVHVSSQIEIKNSTTLPFMISVKSPEGTEEVGVCHSDDEKQAKDLVQSRDGNTFSSHNVGFGIPVHFLAGLGTSSYAFAGQPSITMVISPMLSSDHKAEEASLRGEVVLPDLRSLVQIATSNSFVQSFDVTCAPRDAGQQYGPMVVQICCKVTLVDNSHPFVELFLQPRALLQNNLPVSILVRTPMPHTFSASPKMMRHDASVKSERAETGAVPGQSIHLLDPFSSIKIFTPGPSIAITAKCADAPSGGRKMTWMDGEWADLPLGRNSRLIEPIDCLFPFDKSDGEKPSVARGCEFLIVEGLNGPLAEHNEEKGLSSRSDRRMSGKEVAPTTKSVLEDLEDPNAQIRTLSFAVRNFALDHTGRLLFEQVAVDNRDGSPRKSSKTSGVSRTPSSIFNQSTAGSIPFSSFSSSFHRSRISLLPGSDITLRLIELTMEGDDGTERSEPFVLEGIPLSEGGIESVAITWDDQKNSGYFAYRRLSSFNQCEVHLIPEYVVYNGGDEDQVIVKASGENYTLDQGGLAPIRGGRDHAGGLIIMVEFTKSSASTAPIKADSLGIKLCVVRSTEDGRPIGSVAIQTVIGRRDSRLVVKIGAIKFGGTSGVTDANLTGKAFEKDFLRFRIRWSEMEVTLIDTQRAVGRAHEKHRLAVQESSASTRIASVNNSSQNSKSMAQILFHRFTVDYQRIFKDEDKSTRKSDENFSNFSTERTQIAVIIHSVCIKDCDPNAVSPIVLESPSKSHFFDLCIRTRGSHSADLVKVDLIDLNLAYGDGKSNVIVISTGEDFLWRLFDLASRTLEATAEIAGVNIELAWDDDKGTFIVSTVDMNDDEEDFDPSGVYTPPEADTMYNIRTARVSPTNLLVSFKRQPSRSRYQLAKGVRGAKLMNYITTRLKFTVEKADIRFAPYVAKNVKGPPDRLIEMITAVYSSRMKFKLVTLLNSVTLQDWKYLSGREDHGDEFVEGDILRSTGNLAGRSAGYVLKKVGQGLGDGVSSVTGSIGNEIQRTSEKMGAGAVGAGMNSVVSGLGDGVGTSIKGVGAGSGKLFRGVGKGLGQVVGGVGGGMQLAAKGIGKSIRTGDGKAIAQGLGDGLNSFATGIGRGVETAALGTTDGVITAGQGLVSGVASVGKGLGGAFVGGRRTRVGLQKREGRYRQGAKPPSSKQRSPEKGDHTKR